MGLSAGAGQSRSILRCLTLALLVAPFTAFAGETGSVTGTVTDAAGDPLPGVVVKIAGAQLPAGRTTVTAGSGAYHLPRVLPGTYDVSAELPGIGKASRRVEVLVDREARIDLILQGKAEVTVAVVADLVDTRSTEVAKNFEPEEIRQLPLPRTYYGLLYLLPAAPVLPNVKGYVPVAGGTRQENKYLIDGVNVTNPGYGFIGIDTNELDVADVNFKTGAISAESGRTPGAIVNAVTRSGTNEFHGGLRVEASPSAFTSASTSDVEQDVDTYTAAASLGFPILKDLLFGYASVHFADSKTANMSTPFGTQPDSQMRTQEYFGKLTAYPADSLLLYGGFRALPIDYSNWFGSSYDAPSAAYGRDSTNYVGNVSANWLPSKDSTLEVRYVHMTEDNTNGATTLLPDRPMTIDPLKLWKYGAYYDPNRNFGNAGVFPFTRTGAFYARDEVRLIAGQFFQIGPTQHEIRLGGGAEFVDYDSFSESNGWGELLYRGTEVRATLYKSQPEQIGRTRTWSAFLQDTVTWGRVSATLGLLANRDDFAQIAPNGTRDNFLTFPWSDELQPRLGLVWNAGILPGDRLYTNFGIYSGLDLKSTVNAFAPFRVKSDFAFFDRTTGAFEREQIRGVYLPKYIPPQLAAPYQQEWVIGYSAQPSRHVTVDLHYQYKNLKRPFEDTPVDPNNYSTSPFQAKTFPDARRVYRGWTLSMAKPYSNGWQASLSYTYSKLYGNWDEDYGTGLYNTSSLLEDGPGWNSAEPNRYGRLGMDTPHILKLFASGDLARFTLGAFFRVQSGLAWQATGQDFNGSYNRYLEPAGSRRTPTMTTLDLLGAYSLDLGRGLSLRVEARVANLFNSQTPLAVDTVQYLDPYLDGTPPSTLGRQGTSQPNPTFGMPYLWANPRQFILTAWVDF